MLVENATLIPLFPLPLVVFPGETLPLHIFEPRYRELVSYCRSGAKLGSSRPFGLSYAEEGELSECGCSLEITEVVTEYEDGRMDIQTLGLRRYRVEKIDRELPYYRAWVTFFEDETEPEDLSLRLRLFQMHERLIERVKRKPTSLALEEADSFRLASEAGLSAKQKQTLLESTSENERMELLAVYYGRTLETLEEAAQIKKRIRANGFFRKLSGIDI